MTWLQKTMPKIMTIFGTRPEAIKLAPVIKALDRTVALTAGNRGMVLNLAVSYSGREEIAHAVRAIATPPRKRLMRASSPLNRSALSRDWLAR